MITHKISQMFLKIFYTHIVMCITLKKFLTDYNLSIPQH